MPRRVSIFPLQRSFLLSLLLLPSVSVAFNNSKAMDPEDRSGTWSIGAYINWQESPYAGEEWRSDFMPQFVYTGENIYLDTTQMGWHAIDNDDWQLDTYVNYYLNGYNDHTFYSDTGEVRDEDDPLKGMERSSSFELGIALTRKTDYGRWSVAASHDINGTHNGGRMEFEWSKTWRREKWQLQPWLRANYYSRETANYYFGVTADETLVDRPEYALDATASVEAGASLRMTAWERHNFSLNAGYTVFNDDITDSPVISENAVFNTSLSYRYEIDDLNRSSTGDYNFFTNNPNPWSFRIAYGCTSDTSLNKILRLQIDCQGDGTHLGSFFLSRQLSETFMTLPIEAWITTGVARRFESEYQGNFWEGVVAFKAVFRQFPWSDTVETRFGVAEGVSYAQKVPNIESERADDRDRRNSKFLNYLDFSLDVSLGDVIGNEKLQSCFVGFSVHHRSGIFGASDLYGNVYGGSNVNTMYIECEQR